MTMSRLTISASMALKTSTYLVLCILIFIAFYKLNYQLSAELISLSLILTAYTIIFCLPVTRFKLGPSGFEAELERLEDEKPRLPETTEEAVAEEVERVTPQLIEPDIILMRLVIDVEITLRRIAEISGVRNLRVSMGRLTSELERNRIITDKWLLNALDFFRKYRNELLHEGKTTDIEVAIDIGSTILAYLKDIEENL